jgi:diacylglycerol kinase (ATP)
MESKHSLIKSFGFAFEGLKAAILKGRNFRIQLTIGTLAVILGVILKLSLAEWLDLVIIITLVLILELINTSLEALVDLVSPEIREKAKLAKDVAASTVLIASIGSIVIGVLLFLPKLLKVV